MTYVSVFGYRVVVVVVVVVVMSPSGYCRCPEEMRNSTRLWIRRDPSLPRDSWQLDSHFIDWGITQGRLSLPTADVLLTVVKRSMLTDDDTLPSCSQFSDSVVGFTGKKTQPTASKYWRSNQAVPWVSECQHTTCVCVCQVMLYICNTMDKVVLAGTAICPQTWRGAGWDAQCITDHPPSKKLTTITVDHLTFKAKICPKFLTYTQ